MSGSRPELGSKISLISKADIRYEGRLYTVDRQECTIALSSVRSFGTEDRETQSQIAPQSQIYDYILFRGIDIKDIRVINNSLPHPNDPAIMQVQLPNGQHVMPHLSMPGMNTQQVPPMGGVINNSLPYPNDPAIMQVQLPNGQHVMPHLSMPGMNTQQVPPMGGVINNSLPYPNDPAIMQVQLPNGQHVMPHLSMPGMNTQQVPPMGGVGTYGNPFEPMGGLGATGGGGGGVPQSLEPGSGAPGPFMMGNQQVPPQPKQPQNQQSQTQQQQKQTNKPPKRKSEEQTSAPTEIVVVKCCLRSTCKNDVVFQKIQKDVREMSSLFVEVSVYIHFSLMKRWKIGDFQEVNFLDYYYHLMKGTKDKYALDPEYATLRDKAMPLYDKKYRSNLFVHSANQYKTIFHNNIWMHAYNRIRRFFKYFDVNNTEIYNTLTFVFENRGEENANKLLLDKLRSELKWNGEPLNDLQNQKKYWKYIQLFYNLQRYNEEKKYKNLSLIPMFKHGMHHIRYDTTAFKALLASKDLSKIVEPEFKTIWHKYFIIPETRNKNFHCSLQTDGVSVSFAMDKPKKVIPEVLPPKRKKHQRDENESIGNLMKIRNTQYDNKIGLDPGLRLTFGGVINGQPYKLSNSKFQAMNGHHSRKIQLGRFTNWFSEKSQESPNQADFLAYNKHRLAIFKLKQSAFAQRKVTRLNMKKYICVEKATHKIAKMIVPNKSRKTLICIGSTEIAANSPMKGYIRTPNKKIIAALRHRGADILFVNEFRTTKLCGNCHWPNITSRSPHRYQFCENCRTCWNRDVNAGVNILYLGECVINEIEKHQNFRSQLIN